MQNGPSTRGFVPFWCAGDFVPSSLRKGSSTPGERAEKIYEVFFQRKSGIKRRITSRDTDICLFAASVSSFSFSSRPWDVFDPGNGLRPAALFSGEEESKRMRATGSIVLCLLISFYLFFFFRKKKSKRRRKREDTALLLLFFLIVFFLFKKGQKGRGKGRCGVQGIAFSAIFVLFFVKKNGKRKAKRRELSFGSFCFS